MQLRLVNVKSGELFLYAGKDQEPCAEVEAGMYYATATRLDKSVYRRHGAVAACRKDRSGFVRLFPPALHVKRELTGWTPAEASLQRAVPDPDQPQVPLPLFPNLPYRTRHLSEPRVPGTVELYTWQYEVLADCARYMQAKVTYRRGWECRGGGGKTLPGLAIASLWPGHALVVAESYYQKAWRDQAERYGLPLPRLATYGSLDKVLADINSGWACRCVVFDETFLVSNPDTQRYRVATMISLMAGGAVVGGTGSPISVSPDQARWVNVIYPGWLPENDNAFKHAYAVGVALREVKPGVQVWSPGRDENGRETWDVARLTRDIAPVVKFVDSSILERELPPKSRHRRYVPRPSRYPAVLSGAYCASGSPGKIRAQALEASDGAVTAENGVVVELGREKIDAAVALLRDLAPEPIVFIACWISTQRRLVAALTAAGYDPVSVTAESSERDAAEAQRRLIEGETRAFVLSSKKTRGMDGLQSVCRTIVRLSTSNSPLDLQQGEWRLDRAGQTREVQVIDLLAADTLDEATLDRLLGHGDASAEFHAAGLAADLARLKRAEGLGDDPVNEVAE